MFKIDVIDWHYSGTSQVVKNDSTTKLRAELNPGKYHLRKVKKILWLISRENENISYNVNF